MKHTQQSLESMRAMDAEQETQRLKLGDQLGVTRVVDHYAFFAKKADAQSAVRELTEDGFTVKLSRKALTWCLEAQTESDVELETVDAFVNLMFDFVQRHNGIYDGWGAPVILKETE